MYSNILAKHSIYIIWKHKHSITRYILILAIVREVEEPIKLEDHEEDGDDTYLKLFTQDSLFSSERYYYQWWSCEGGPSVFEALIWATDIMQSQLPFN